MYGSFATFAFFKMCYNILNILCGIFMRHQYRIGRFDNNVITYADYGYQTCFRSNVAVMCVDGVDITVHNIALFIAAAYFA